MSSKTEHILEGIKTFPSAYFALVMATGIISIAAYLLAMKPIALILFGLNILFFITLWGVNIFRIIRYRDAFLSDIKDHQHGPGFFTAVAGTCVLGSQFIVIFNNYYIAGILLCLGIFLWICLTYSVFTSITIKENKPPLEKGLTGAWLIAVVATQSVALLSALFSPHLEQPYRLQLNYLALSMWLWGGMLYIWMISLIFYRYTFFKFSPDDLTPPYWINMGAMAISTLAGVQLIINTPHAPFLNSLLPFLKGFTVFYWATGTWWIPMLFILAIWRHIYKRFPLRYDPLYWGGVFPLGMYVVCTYQMAGAMELTFLYVIPRYFIYVAISAWLATFIGLLRWFVRNLVAKSSG